MSIPKNEAILRIKNLNLSNIKTKLMKTNGLNQKQVDCIELWYKRFLEIHLKYPDQDIVPNQVIDEMWHLHILDTRKYANDCQSIFGEFIHHNPSYSHKESKASNEAFDKTNLYFRIEFGEDCTEMFSSNELSIVIATSDMKVKKGTCYTDSAKKSSTCDHRKIADQRATCD